MRIKLRALVAALALLGWAAPAAIPAQAQDHRADASAVVAIKSRVPADARSARTLGREREGNGVVIDSSGLILTVGYLILEANEVEVRHGGRQLSASVVAYDWDTGFGLVRTAVPIKVKPILLGDSDAATVRRQMKVQVADQEHDVLVVDRRDFAGYWEYLLERAIFTSPPVASWGGAALLDEQGRLVGVGSLFVDDAFRGSGALPGNMFIPINRLKPVLADLLSLGRSSAPPRPWIGIYLQQHPFGLVVTFVTPGGPAATAGLQRGDIVVGLGEREIDDPAEFWRALWASGEAGVEVKVRIRRDDREQALTVRSADRGKFLKLDGSL